MVDVIDSLDICGMKQTDFLQLKEMYEHVKEEGCYWGRKDYWNDRISRLDIWFEYVTAVLIGVKIPD